MDLPADFISGLEPKQLDLLVQDQNFRREVLGIIQEGGVQARQEEEVFEGRKLQLEGMKDGMVEWHRRLVQILRVCRIQLQKALTFQGGDSMASLIQLTAYLKSQKQVCTILADKSDLLSHQTPTPQQVIQQDDFTLQQQLKQQMDLDSFIEQMVEYKYRETLQNIADKRLRVLQEEVYQFVGGKVLVPWEGGEMGICVDDLKGGIKKAQKQIILAEIAAQTQLQQKQLVKTLSKFSARQFQRCKIITSLLEQQWQEINNLLQFTQP